MLCCNINVYMLANGAFIGLKYQLQNDDGDCTIQCDVQLHSVVKRKQISLVCKLRRKRYAMHEVCKVEVYLCVDNTYISLSHSTHEELHISNMRRACPLIIKYR